MLKEGDRVLGDGVLRQCANFSLDESQLTGESEPIVKKASLDPAPRYPGVGTSKTFAGSIVLTGRQAYGEVLQTGLKTRLGKIAQLVSDTDEEATPLQKKTGTLVGRLVLVAAGVALGR